MSAAELERELSDYLANSGYEVRFRRYATDSVMVTVLHNGEWLAEKLWLQQRRRYPKAARWAKGQVVEHQEAMRVLAGLTPPRSSSGVS